MEIFKQDLITQANNTEFHPEILEKVWRLLSILQRINSDSYLKPRIALKGGTALNLFFFNLPRLSVDIDLNYIGPIETEKMLSEKLILNAKLEETFKKERLTIHRIPHKHAGGKWQLKYPSALGGFGNIEVDLNFMFRIPIWEILEKSSFPIGLKQIHNIALFNEYELVAGKLIAFFARHASRDLFDIHQIFTNLPLNQEKLRFTFILYGAMSSLDFRNISLDGLNFEMKELQTKLIPVLRRNSQNFLPIKNGPQTILNECKDKLSFLFPFRKNEKKFLNLLYEKGTVDATLLTLDKEMIEKIEQLPNLKWRAQLMQKNRTSQLLNNRT